MRKFLLTLSVACALAVSVLKAQPNNYGDDTTNVYLLHSPFRLYTAMNGRMLTTSNCCAVMGPNNLRIMPDAAHGIRVEGSSMEVTDYFWLRFENVCTGEKFRVRSGKENIYLEPAGDQFPYALTNGRLDTVAKVAGPDWEAWEWDTMIHYGYPDTNLAHAPIMQHTDPYMDSCTGISKGRMECYHGNPYNLDKVINNNGDTVALPDGTYWFTNQLYLSPNIVDPGPYPHKVTYLATFTGSSFQWETSMPLSTPPANPTSVAATVLPDKKTVTLTWSQAGPATRWVIQQKYDWGQNKGSSSGPAITVTGNTQLTLIPGKGKWRFEVQTFNCTEPSIAVWSNSVNVTK